MNFFEFTNNIQGNMKKNFLQKYHLMKNESGAFN